MRKLYSRYWHPLVIGLAGAALVPACGADEFSDQEASGDEAVGLDFEPAAVRERTSIPARIEAEDFNAAIERDGFLGDNECQSSVDGRVDIQKTGDSAGGRCNVGWTKSGEKLDYRVSVNSTTNFKITARVASYYQNKRFHIEVDGENVSGPLTSPSNGWQSYGNRSAEDVSIAAGNHTISVVFDSGSVNLNYLDIQSGTPRPAPGDGCDYWIAYDADGNEYDYDDIHATAMSLALIAQAGLQDCVVHFAYNTNISGTDDRDGQAEDQASFVGEAIQRYGYDSSVFFNVNGVKGAEYSNGRTNFADVMQQLGPDRRLAYIVAGPQQVPYDFITAGPDQKEQFITVVSHSIWNESFAHGPLSNVCFRRESCWCDDFTQCSGAESDQQIYMDETLDVKLHDINDQNGPAFKSEVNEWQWLRQLDDDNFLWDAVTQTGPEPKKGDASDAGMTYYVIERGLPASDDGTKAIDGSISPTMNQVRAFFGVD